MRPLAFMAKEPLVEIQNWQSLTCSLPFHSNFFCLPESLCAEKLSISLFSETLETLQFQCSIEKENHLVPIFEAFCCKEIYLHITIIQFVNFLDMIYQSIMYNYLITCGIHLSLFVEWTLQIKTKLGTLKRKKYFMVSFKLNISMIKTEAFSQKTNNVFLDFSMNIYIIFVSYMLYFHIRSIFR